MIVLGQLVDVPEETIKNLCNKSKEILLSEPTLLELEGPINICGMINEQFILKISFDFQPIWNVFEFKRMAYRLYNTNSFLNNRCYSWSIQ